jgi:tRNA A-37 threonylcarbamoyl transferase component Bud32
MEGAEEDLLTALKRGMSWQKRIDVAVDVARGVAAIHKVQYIYQDLKPQNVMVFLTLLTNQFTVPLAILKGNQAFASKRGWS